MIPSEILDYYGAGKEEERLKWSLGRLEQVRTWEIIERHLPPPPSRVLDVGGGTGVYALPLARRGYHVQLIDPVPWHVERARALSEASDTRLMSAEIGDARKLDVPDATFAAIVDRDLADGVHQNPTKRLDWFTTAYLHRPEEIRPEIEEAGLLFDNLIAVEGPGWMNQNLDTWLDDDVAGERLLHVLRRLETEPSLIGVSAQLLSVAHR